MTTKKHLLNFPVIANLEIIESPEKLKRKKNKRVIVPVRKICEVCKKRRVKNHHHKCEFCWKESHLTQKELDKRKINEF